MARRQRTQVAHTHQEGCFLPQAPILLAFLPQKAQPSLRALQGSAPGESTALDVPQN